MIQDEVRSRLDELLPEPLDHVLELKGERYSGYWGETVSDVSDEVEVETKIIQILTSGEPDCGDHYELPRD